jgi:hypothetical protein
MKKLLLAGVALFALAGCTTPPAPAQTWTHHASYNPACEYKVNGSTFYDCAHDMHEQEAIDRRDTAVQELMRAQTRAANAMTAAAILSAMPLRPIEPAMPTHIWVSPCTIYNQIARQC